MSYIAMKGDASTSIEVETLTNLTELTGGTGLFIRKTGPTTFENATEAGLGTVTQVSIVSANGLAGTVLNANTTPAITLSTSITGILKGNGTAISAATDGTDYLSSTTGLKLDQTTPQTVINGAPLFNVGLKSPKLYPASDSTTAIQFNKADGTTNVMNIDTTNGNVGIGTTNPAYKLDVAGNARFTSDLSARTLATYSVPNNTWAYTLTTASGSGNNSGFWVNSDGTADMRLRALDGTVRVLINSNSGGSYINGGGNLGIGTASPNQLLTVENSMSLKEIASANADTAAYGQIWVKNTTPNTLFFTNDDGTDEEIMMIGDAPTAHSASHAVGAADSVFPADPGADRYLMWDDDPGQLVWAEVAGSGANTALSNLASVAINTTLVSDTDNTDALGTAAISWSDLFLGSGSVITWSTAPSTADVTLTHSENTLTLAGGDLALGANNLTMTGSIAATGNRVTKGWFTDLECTNAIAGSITGNAVTFTAADEASDTTCFPVFVTAATGSLGGKTNAGLTFNSSTGQLQSTLVSAATGFVPDANDGAYLGTTALGFSDLFLATGGVINWANGEITLTGGADTLTMAGGNLTLGTTASFTCGTIELGAASDTTISRSAAGVIAVEGTAIPKGTGTTNEIAYWSGTNTLGTLATATYPSLTELSYVKGLSSAIQTQLNAKAPSANPTFTGTVTLPKTLEIQDASADHQYVLAVNELTADRTVTLPLLTGDDEFTFNAHTQTLTNKRMTERVTAITSHATPTVNTDNCNFVDITALAEAITNMSTNLSGTPTNKQKLIFEIKDNGTARAIAWGTSFVAGGVALPTTTVANKILTVGFMYSTANALNKWRCIASAQEA